MAQTTWPAVHLDHRDLRRATTIGSARSRSGTVNRSNRGFRTDRVRYDNVSVEIGDGYHGWLECGPFDAIVVTAALGHVSPPLIEQLKVGGRLVMPLGSME